jgi:hypothetical protein
LLRLAAGVEQPTLTRSIRLALLFVGLCLIAWLVWRADPHVVARMILRLGWRFGLVVIVYTCYVIVRAAALQRTVIGVRPRFSDVLRIRLSAEAVEWLTFTGPFLSEPAQGWLLTERGVSPFAAFAAVVTEYLLYSASSSILAIPAMALLLSRYAIGEMRTAAALIVLLMTTYLCALAFASISGIGLIAPSLRRLAVVFGRRAERAATQFEPIEHLVIVFLHERRRRLAEVMALEAAAQLVLILELWIIMAALTLSRSLIDAATIEGGVKFVAAVFVLVPGQVGASETVYAWLARAIGLSAAAGVSFALVRRLRGFVVAIAALVVLAAEKGPRRAGSA